MPSPGPSLPLRPRGQRRTTPPQSRCLHGWVNSRSIIPSTPRQHLSREKAVQKKKPTTKQNKTTPKKGLPHDLMEALAEASSRAPRR